MRNKTHCRYSFVSKLVGTTYISMATMSPLGAAEPASVGMASSFSNRTTDLAVIHTVGAVQHNSIAPLAMLQLNSAIIVPNPTEGQDSNDREQNEAVPEKSTKEGSDLASGRRSSTRPPLGRISWREIVNWQELHEQALKKPTTR